LRKKTGAARRGKTVKVLPTLARKFGSTAENHVQKKVRDQSREKLERKAE